MTSFAPADTLVLPVNEWAETNKNLLAKDSQWKAAKAFAGTLCSTSVLQGGENVELVVPSVNGSSQNPQKRFSEKLPCLARRGKDCRLQGKIRRQRRLLAVGILIALAVYCREKPISCTLSVAWCGDVNVGGGCESNFGFVAGHVVGLDPFCRDHRLAGNAGWHLFLHAVALSAGAISVFRFQSLRFRRPGEA